MNEWLKFHTSLGTTLVKYQEAIGMLAIDKEKK